MYKRILCPVDGSKTSNYGLMTAIQFAKDQGAALMLLHVVDMYLPIQDATGEYNLVLIDEILRKNGKKTLKKAETLAIKAGISVETRIIEVFGPKAAETILEQAKTWSADIIVMGTHGLRGVKRLVMGSDAETVVRNSPIPVLLVRNKPHAH